MTDYYAILGVARTASDSEIKTAFRKLAKIYHPDKNPNNPNSKGIFEQVLLAYNVLINPHSRKRYDTKTFNSNVNQKQTQTQKSSKKSQKQYSTTDEELKQREYYKNYYKHAKKKASINQVQAGYNDYKYILFATPLAVGLLMLVMSMFTSEPKIENTKEIKKDTIIKVRSHL